MTHAEAPALVADIGGTNTRVALAQGSELLTDTIHRFRNAEYPDLETVLRHYIEGRGNTQLSGACVAVAGPVRDGIGRLTNLNWQIDTETLARAAGTGRVAILNDLQAQGHALDYLDEPSLRPVLSGAPEGPNATRLVIGIGTGFNAAAVIPGPNGPIVTAAEAGHVALPVENEDDLALATFVKGADDFAAVEDVLSGRGLSRLFSWVTTRAGTPEQADAAAVMGMLAQGDAVAAEEAARIFTRHLGIASGNLALTFLPFGGIYLCGGVARAVAPYLQQLGFPAAFHGKGRFTGFLEGFAISVIEDDYAALTGCAAHLVHK
ncbi:glucokinase [Actibacterium lipolyticum]|uniref:Glucokinase n=1 Tax=Actibacterium lipolyticum TaxID=1524263 RepID=A0A238JVQ1_9RHOB|nr:ROK family protein [Actibacterium lipolyticum]SMX34758.1 Glucokinase [Actibacterium lipolyticum]